jgi:CheY-like chemotaxis protein
MLRNQVVLIVEDEAFTALTLAGAIEDAGGCVVGPVGTVAEALVLIGTQEISAAVLDANLADRDVTPVAIILAGKKIPFVVFSGTGLPSELAAIQPDIAVVMKPAALKVVLNRLVEQIKGVDREVCTS